MTDPWDVGAGEITRRKARERQEVTDKSTAAEEERLAEAAAIKEAEDKAYQEMQAAKTEGVAALTKFMYERGEPAKRLLAAYSDRAHVMFGVKRGGGHYESVFLHGNGLRREVGGGGSYNTSPSSNEPATPEQAVDMFARHGEGRGNPELVRNIVSWLTEEVDRFSQG